MIPALIFIVLLVFVAIEHVWLLGTFWAAWYVLLNGGMYLVAHPWQAIGYAAGYFLVGAVWSVVKWWRHEVARVEEARAEFALYARPNQSWADYTKTRKSNVSHEKGIIIAWIAFWPFNALWTLLDDPIRRLCTRIYKELYRVYQRITDAVWAS